MKDEKKREASRARLCTERASEREQGRRYIERKGKNFEGVFGNRIGVCVGCLAQGGWWDP